MFTNGLVLGLLVGLVAGVVGTVGVVALVNRVHAAKTTSTMFDILVGTLVPTPDRIVQFAGKGPAQRLFEVLTFQCGWLGSRHWDSLEVRAATWIANSVNCLMACSPEKLVRGVDVHAPIEAGGGESALVWAALERHGWLVEVLPDNSRIWRIRCAAPPTNSLSSSERTERSTADRQAYFRSILDRARRQGITTYGVLTVALPRLIAERQNGLDPSPTPEADVDLYLRTAGQLLSGTTLDEIEEAVDTVVSAN